MERQKATIIPFPVTPLKNGVIVKCQYTLLGSQIRAPCKIISYVNENGYKTYLIKDRGLKIYGIAVEPYDQGKYKAWCGSTVQADIEFDEDIRLVCMKTLDGRDLKYEAIWSLLNHMGFNMWQLVEEDLV